MAGDISGRVRQALEGWFTRICLERWGRDYGSELRNQYIVYRRLYGMDATQAWHEAHRGRRMLGDGS